MSKKELDIDKIIDSIRGTNKSVKDVLPKGVKLTDKELGDINEKVMAIGGIIDCPGCGWWDDIGEADDEGYCNGCSPDQGDD